MAWHERVTGHGHSTWARWSVGRSKDASAWPESCTVSRRPSGGYRTMGRSREPPAEAPFREVPCPRSVRSAPFATTARPLPTSRLVVAPPYDVIGPAEHERLLGPASGQRRAARPARPRSRATSPTTGIGARPGRSRPGGPTGRSTRTRIRRSTSTSRPIACPARDVSRTQRGFFARLRLEAFGPASGVLPHERTMPAARRIATSCCARRGSTRARSSSCTTTRRPSAGRCSTRSRRVPPDGRHRGRRRRAAPTLGGAGGRRRRRAGSRR